MTERRGEERRGRTKERISNGRERKEEEETPKLSRRSASEPRDTSSLCSGLFVFRVENRSRRFWRNENRNCRV